MSEHTFAVIIFDKRLNDWTYFKEGYENREDAQKFIDAYPRFGSDYSRTIREGNWQIIPV